MAVLCRRLYARHIVPRAQHLAERVREIEKGKYEKPLRALKSADIKDLKRLYKERENEPEMAGEDWTPESNDYL
jgi:sensor domain CHASE-containing protein